MRLIRILLIAALMSLGIVVATDAGLFTWITPAQAHHKDSDDDDNLKPTDNDDEDNDAKEELRGRQRCRERPFPAECRRRKKKQERREEKPIDEGGGGGPVVSPTASASPTASPSPSGDCPLEAIPVLGPILCDLIGGGVPVP